MIPRKDTTKLLEKLRSLMRNVNVVPEPIQAYVITSGDPHQSEYIAECDERRSFISGFTGSAGMAIVTENKASLWTDGRYFLQAEQQLDSNWILVKEGLPTSETPGSWLNSVLPSGSKVGVDAYLIAAETWLTLAKSLESSGNSLVAVAKNLVDEIWDDKPARPLNAITPLPSKYTGCTWQEKVQDVRSKMKEKKADVVVLTALDDIAWLLNVRGSDIAYNPVFFSYVFVTMDAVHFFVNPDKVTKDVRDHLSGEGNIDEVHFHPYESVGSKLQEMIQSVPGKIWVSDKSSYALYNMISNNRLISDTNPVRGLKAIKNVVEIQGMRNSSIRDAVALCQYFCWLESEVPKGGVTEISGAKKLKEFRMQQTDFVGNSFTTISSSGPNGAVIHYSPSESTNRPVTTTEMYLCDSGGQYLDGTTDVTRTMHFGTPSAYEMECFTRVLKGHIALATIRFPRLLKGVMLDTLARVALWNVGLDYQHGTGHGVGAYLNVHEGPSGIGMQPKPEDPGIQERMIMTNEPGYYEEGKFGCRIENMMLVKETATKFTTGKKTFLAFEPLTLVPIQTKLVEPSLLTSEEIDWLNDYHAETLAVLGPLLRSGGHGTVLEWLTKETRPLAK